MLELGTPEARCPGEALDDRAGKVTAQMGISVDTCPNLLKWMELCDLFNVSDLELIVAAALTADARDITLR
jgi:hypothetical protein